MWHVWGEEKYIQGLVGKPVEGGFLKTYAWTGYDIIKMAL